MAKAGLGVKLAAGCLLLLSATTSAEAAPTVAQMLSYKPRQEGVAIETPLASELAACEVKLVTGSQPGSSGWLLLGPRKQPLRRFFDSNGDKKIDVWSYYKNGEEVYREVDSNYNDRPDQYRWLNSGGMKWGVDVNEDGKIDGWKMIAAEEVAHEAFLAVASRDFNRLRLLFINETELQALRLPAKESERIRAQVQQASERFHNTLKRMPPTAKVDSAHVEAATPHCWPSDSSGAATDMLRHPNRSVLFEVGDGKHEWLQTGEMIQIGAAWRLVDAPSIGDLGPSPKTQKPELQKLLEILASQDEKMPGPDSPRAVITRYYLTRASIVEQLVNHTEGNERETWLRQLADNLGAVVQHSPESEKQHLDRLRHLRDQMVKTQPGSNLAGYMTYRVLMAEYAHKLVTPGKDLVKNQAEWQEKLAGFVAAYPRAEDTPDALLQLGMGSEFAGKDEEAKRWYQQLASTFPQHALAAKAEGAVRRLSLVGKNIDIQGQTLTGQPFNLASLKGKVVAVYYWASYCTTCNQDFPALKKIHDSLAAKGFEIVTINLDDRPEDAQRYLAQKPLPGIHLHSPATEGGGLNSPLAVQYGIMGLPNLFLIGKDGTVTSRTIQVMDLEDAVRKGL